MVGVVTQGRSDTSNQWVTSYTVAHSNDDTTFVDVDGGATFSGNSDRSTKITQYFTTSVSARYIRIYVASSSVHASMRAAVVTGTGLGKAAGINNGHGLVYVSSEEHLWLQHLIVCWQRESRQHI